MQKQFENAFLAGLEENKQKLLRICTIYSKDEDDKKDLFQEVLINIWRSMPSFKGNSSLSTWMFRVTLNVCLRVQSKEGKKKKLFAKMESIELLSHSYQAFAQEENEQIVYLRHCIRNLNEAERAIVSLYLEELPYKEISEITGLTENHIAVKLKRIKAKLLNCINKNL